MRRGVERRQRAGTIAGRWLAPLLIAALIVGLDRLSKVLVRGWLPERAAGSRVDLLGEWFGLDYVENRGAAFGTLDGYGGLLTVLALAVVVAMIVFYARVAGPSPWLRLGLGLLVGGAVGNVLDRLLHGYVVDFVAVGPWPRFNLADSAITTGVLLLAWRLSGDDLAPHGPATAEERPNPADEPMAGASAQPPRPDPEPEPTGSNHE